MSCYASFDSIVHYSYAITTKCSRGLEQKLTTHRAQQLRNLTLGVCASSYLTLRKAHLLVVTSALDQHRTHKFTYFLRLLDLDLLSEQLYITAPTCGGGMMLTCHDAHVYWCSRAMMLTCGGAHVP